MPVDVETCVISVLSAKIADLIFSTFFV